MDIIDDLNLVVDLDIDQLARQILYRLHRMEHNLMSSLSDLQAADTALDSEVTAIVTALGGLYTQITDLKNQLGQGIPANEAQVIAADLAGQAKALGDALAAGQTAIPLPTPAPGLTSMGTPEPPMVQPGFQSPATSVVDSKDGPLTHDASGASVNAAGNTVDGNGVELLDGNGAPIPGAQPFQA